jgi:hypothetical protein
MRFTQWTRPGVLVILLLALPASPPATAQTIDNLSYFETQVAAACTAGDPNNPGTFSRQSKGGANDCPGLVVYYVAKGAGSIPWSSESFYVQSGYLKQMIEVGYDTSTGSITDYRAFRDTASGSKGIISMAATMGTGGASYTIPHYVEEHWTDNSGQPVCFNTKHDRVDTGSGTNGSVYPGGTLTGWLQDKRAASLNQSTWHNVDTIIREDHWGGNFVEYYTYGRWLNPATSTWQGLGLIKWDFRRISPAAQLGYSENHYLVDCSTNIPCTTCPP